MKVAEAEKIPLSDSLISNDLVLTPEDNKRLAKLRGQFDENIRLLEDELNVEIKSRGNHFRVIGPQTSSDIAMEILQELYEETNEQTELTTGEFHLLIKEKTSSDYADAPTDSSPQLSVRTRHGLVKARTPTQKKYISNILSTDLSFGIGPAGTGKTFLAIACAVEALETHKVHRIVLARPAVEAGERLGFLPGDLAQKIDPYCRPVYDALYDILGVEKVTKLIERQTIEVAPLAYMRGRTLTDAFVILDEAQNTTCEQMKMFLTRMGHNCTVVVTGDITQIDLPHGQLSGLKDCIRVLKNIPEIRFIYFESQDVVRHNLVQKIIEAYDVKSPARQ